MFRCEICYFLIQLVITLSVHFLQLKFSLTVSKWSVRLLWLIINSIYNDYYCWLLVLNCSTESFIRIGQSDKAGMTCYFFYLPSMLWRCWLGGRKGIWPVKTEWWDSGMVISELLACPVFFVLSCKFLYFKKYPVFPVFSSLYCMCLYTICHSYKIVLTC